MTSSLPTRNDNRTEPPRFLRHSVLSLTFSIMTQVRNVGEQQANFDQSHCHRQGVKNTTRQCLFARTFGARLAPWGRRTDQVIGFTIQHTARDTKLSSRHFCISASHGVFTSVVTWSLLVVLFSCFSSGVTSRGRQETQFRNGAEGVET